MSTKTVWTEADERQLEELTDRRNAFKREAKQTVEDVVSGFHHHNMTCNALTNNLIENAADVIEVLKPFAEGRVPK